MSGIKTSNNRRFERQENRSVGELYDTKGGRYPFSAKLLFVLLSISDFLLSRAKRSEG